MDPNTFIPNSAANNSPMDLKQALRRGFPEPLLGAEVQLQEFLSALFKPDDLVELRSIEMWSTSSGKSTRLRNREWYRPIDVVEMLPRIQLANSRGGNILFGVNPRRYRGGKKSAVECCRSVWIDMDHVTYDVAMERIAAVAPRPSVVFCSGSGVHAYWLLEKPYALPDRAAGRRYERMLKALYTDLGCDSVQDVSRMLRLPGFYNCKEFKNGIPPQETRLLDCMPDRRYPLEAFDTWWQRGLEEVAQSKVNQLALPQELPTATPLEIRALVERLDLPTNDRSKRDYAVLLELLRMGTPVERIWKLVRGRSKFATAGRAYFDVSLSNALRTLAKES